MHSRPDTVGAWRDGDLLVIQRGAALPRRCIVTNEPVAGFLATRLYWHRPAWYLALVLIPGLYLIHLLVFAASIDVICGLSRRVLRRRRISTIGASVAVSAGFLIASVAGHSSNSILAVLGYTVILGGVAWWTLGTRLLRSTRMDSGHAWIKGAHPEYLACLPMWSGSPSKRIEQNARR